MKVERSGWRWSSLGVGLFGIAVLMVLSPMAGATSAGATHVTIKAPYTGATGYSSYSVSSAGCGGASVPVKPFFQWATGAAGFIARTHASACPGSYGDSGGASASETATVPFPAFTGNDVIHAKVAIHAELRSSISGGSCAFGNASYSECYVYAYAGLSSYAYVIDTTNGSYFIAANYWVGALAQSSLYDECYLGNCTASTTGNSHVLVASHFDWVFHAHGLVASHHYVLQVDWYATADSTDSAYLATLTGVTESASVAAAGPGLGVTLESISIR